MWIELPFFRDLHSKVDLFRTLVSHFKLWRPAIFEPVDLGNYIIRLLKALSSGNWNLEWKWEFLGPGKLQTSFSEGGAFLVIWQVAPPGWCHTQVLYKFSKPYIRALKWYTICVILFFGRWSKWPFYYIVLYYGRVFLQGTVISLSEMPRFETPFFLIGTWVTVASGPCLPADGNKWAAILSLSICFL